jgi:Uma2 family endonuclease
MTQATLIRHKPDQRIVLSGRSWAQFKLIQQGLEDSPGVKMSYFAGTIEILMPGRDHEFFSRFIGFLIGIYCMDKRIEFEPTGSMTQEREPVAAAEPDESYCFEGARMPQLVIEVTFTSGNASKLPRYQALEVPEVWFWEDGLFMLYRLRPTGYERIDRSEIEALADLDIDLLARCVLLAQTSRLEAIAAFREGNH